jgi:hypothetical protein
MTNLTNKQDLAITALLGQPTIAAAAKAAGVSPRAARGRWPGDHAASAACRRGG